MKKMLKVLVREVDKNGKDAEYDIEAESVEVCSGGIIEVKDGFGKSLFISPYFFKDILIEEDGESKED